MNENQQPQHNSRIYTGLFLLAAGILVLAHKMGSPIPDWVFSFGTLFICIGLLSGFKSRFQNPITFIFLIVGGIFLLDEFIPEMHVENYTGAIVLMSIGLLFILRPKHAGRRKGWNSYTGYVKMDDPFGTKTETFVAGTSEEFIDSVAVFGSVKKNIISKNFKGGEVTCFMGGAEFDLTQADIQGTVTLDVTNVFGGTKLIIPANWFVKNEVVAVFGGMDEKRNAGTVTPDINKTILLKGTCVFGGIEIRSY